MRNNCIDYNSYSYLQVFNNNQIPILKNTLPININTQPLINSVDTIIDFPSTHSRRQSNFNYHTSLAHSSLRGNNPKQNKSSVKDLPIQKSSVGINGSTITQDRSTYGKKISVELSNNNHPNNALPENINTLPFRNSVDTSSTHSRRQSFFNYKTDLLTDH